MGMEHCVSIPCCLRSELVFYLEHSYQSHNFANDVLPRRSWWLAVCLRTLASTKLSKPGVRGTSKKYTNHYLLGCLICLITVRLFSSSIYLPEMCRGGCSWHPWREAFGEDYPANGKDAYNLWNKGVQRARKAMQCYVFFLRLRQR